MERKYRGNEVGGTGKRGCIRVEGNERRHMMKERMDMSMERID